MAEELGTDVKQVETPLPIHSEGSKAETSSTISPLRRAVRAFLAGTLVSGIVGTWVVVLIGWGDVETGKEASAVLAPLVGMALTFYFREND